MIRYILVDDEPTTLAFVKTKIDGIAKDFNLKHVKSYSSSLKAFEEVIEEDYDLLIVDFEMSPYNGIELAKKIAENKKVVFLTSTSNNGPKMMNALDVSGYLSKPFDLEEFKDIIKHKVIGKINPTKVSQKPHTITLSIGTNKDVRFPSNQAYYMRTSRNINGEQPNKNCVHIYGKNDVVLYANLRISINELYEKLADYNFEKVDQSNIINMDYLKERDNMHIELQDCSETFEVTAKHKPGFIANLRAKLMR
ncbi:DNA-binding response regulator [Subsaximicrobium wynnwilliamsii]|uniref:DNA-binding response regulator n=1 Tax=Subsaximicrobium wynnwilliamsii TaxID=291179 RepID=A0A5C6ZBE7_9FLAO|nr:response regulator [Subsaximicrobium wynnwilliamsii]TXD80483.1 DNA-binding response regulator [Subsaximicrobium wynnwilliamsii]TXD86091.1 DNA-binding response regulator [Subsaximicrobium wynnwilliamsii]TXD99447.1 DNA-binding response regulator [Subsaximicrobium wynnwilliamsii]